MDILHIVLGTVNKVKTVTCKSKGEIMSEKGVVRTRNHSDLIISASKYYCFQTNVQTCVLNL